MLASRADLLSPCKRRFGQCTLPISGAEVRFRSLSELEYSRFETDRMKRDDDGRLVTDESKLTGTRARLIVLCLCDESGERILGDADADGVQESLDIADSTFLFGELQKFCGMLGADYIQGRDAAKKNSNQTRGVDSR